MEDCIFCKIAKKEIQSCILFEDDKYLVFLDKFPNIQGQALVIPKSHKDSYIFDLEDRDIWEFIGTVKKAAKILEKGLKVHRVNIVLEGLEINHLHAKLYPVIGIESKFEKIVKTDAVNFEKYPGYVTTLHGTEKSIEELDRIKENILKS